MTSSKPLKIKHSFAFLSDKTADCTLIMSDEDLLDLMTGKMNPQAVCDHDKPYLSALT